MLSDQDIRDYARLDHIHLRTQAFNDLQEAGIQVPDLRRALMEGARIVWESDAGVTISCESRVGPLTVKASYEPDPPPPLVITSVARA